jgi:hypothetical protein
MPVFIFHILVSNRLCPVGRRIVPEVEVHLLEPGCQVAVFLLLPLASGMVDSCCGSPKLLRWQRSVVDDRSIYGALEALLVPQLLD